MGQITIRGLSVDLSTVTGIHYLKQVILDRAQLMQLAEALAAELKVTFGDSADDSVRLPGEEAPGSSGPRGG